ncbi:MAG: host attachment protein [Rhodospirillales bacterium]|nr:host attachment protein [Rhodospirillales bacterium]
MRIKTPRTWILVADGARAHVVLSAGPGAGLKAVPGSDIRQEHLPTRDLGTDRPGRAQESVGGARHALVPRVDWHQQQKEQFARAIARKLDAEAAGGSFERLILVAPPQTLGEIRAALKPATMKLVAAEINKDLTHVPIPELGPHLGEAVKV